MGLKGDWGPYNQGIVIHCVLLREASKALVFNIEWSVYCHETTPGKICRFKASMWSDDISSNIFAQETHNCG